ncbi:MAG TPA: hypothetical protein DCW74_18175 [Alteromonas australica]|jgi:DNA-directed RNA polymerase specialized sigma24 family protein|uniref:Uncharacterized protein n=1 Tax=Alteromonas australica TaxID=589873 RepID=A0A350P8N1_9ALTE|nr:hypothetical protein [Alteromonas australica]MBU32634.1 hypothetical protein [Alteromonas sp.]MBU33023.1 hypothetical protein [Alteromonas sp.]HAW77648.1 hypothetical protein [Alteromonas australica]|tara:strand:- start:2410 stop:2949 length:540 start_codon:yes stop_codon:yes gene_type:complete
MQGYKYFDSDEAISQVQCMSEEDILKCLRAAYYFINKYELPIEGEDLFNEALVRILEGKRQLAKSVKIYTAINQIMKSISYEMLTKRSDEAMRNTSPLEDETIVSSFLDGSSEKIDQQWAMLTSLFEEDEDASAFLAATEQGIKKSKIVENFFDGNETTYDSLRRKIIRKATPQMKEFM